jgi:hypothetical protein
MLGVYACFLPRRGFQVAEPDYYFTKLGGANSKNIPQPCSDGDGELASHKLRDQQTNRKKGTKAKKLKGRKKARALHIRRLLGFHIARFWASQKGKRVGLQRRLGCVHKLMRGLWTHLPVLWTCLQSVYYCGM